MKLITKKGQKMLERPIPICGVNILYSYMLQMRQMDDRKLANV